MNWARIPAAWSAVRGAWNTPRALVGLGGLVCSWHLLAAWHQLRTTLGTSLPMGTGMGLALVAGLPLGLWLASRTERGWPIAVRIGLLHFSLAAFSLLAPTLMTAAGAAAGWVGLHLIESSLVPLLFSAAVALGLIGLPVAATVWLGLCLAELHAGQPVSAAIPRRDRQEPGQALRNRQQSSLALFGLALALGIVLFGTCLAPSLGVQGTALLAAVLGSLVFVGCLVDSGREQPCLTLTDSEIATSEPAAPASSRWSVRQVVPQLASLPSAFALGLLFATSGRLVRQLAPASAALSGFEWAWLIGGVSLGLWLAVRQRPGQARWKMVCGLAALIAGLALPAAFPWIVHRLIWIQGTVSYVSGMLALRGVMVGVLVLPIGIALALCGATRVPAPVPAGSSSRPRPVHGLPATGDWMMFALAFFLAHWFWLSSFGVMACWLAALWLAALVLFGEALRTRQLLHSWAGRIGLAALLAVAAAAPLWRAQYRPELSARLLFSTRVTTAQRAGRPPAGLEFLDEGRLVALREGPYGTHTVWRHGGHQLQFRENGVPRAAVSTDLEVFPHYSAEVLHGVIPLTLHDNPQRVLVLGLGGGVPLQVCLASPIREITCVEGDATLVQLVQDLVPRRPGLIDWNDARLTSTVADPILYLTAQTQQFDVIISNPDLAALETAAPHFAVEHYRRAAARLTADGIFCQRLTCHDFGPEPVRMTAASLRMVFEQVTAVQTAAGEMLFLATNDPRGFVRPGLLSRAEAPHIRELLGRLNWDWTVPLTLAAYNVPALLERPDGEAASIQAHTAANGYFAFQLPNEVMRWGAKTQEIQDAFGGRTIRLLDQMGSDAERPELLRRLAEVRGQQDLLVKYSDQYWAYRASVREQVSRHPKSLVRQTVFDPAEIGSQSVPRGLDPEDRHRMLYFSSLGAAAKSRRLEDIRKVESFQAPYDPLLTFFIHGEAAELYKRTGHPDPASEFRHRLHTIYYAHPYDQSLHNVTAAIDLLIHYPEIEPQPLARWDQLNALVQTLSLRWQTRAQFGPGVPFKTVRDIDLCLVAADKAFAALDQLTVEAGLPPETWKQRQTVLEQDLIIPLRAYRRNLMPYVGRQQMLAEMGDDEPPAPEEEAAQINTGAVRK